MVERTVSFVKTWKLSFYPLEQEKNMSTYLCSGLWFPSAINSITTFSDGASFINITQECRDWNSNSYLNKKMIFFKENISELLFRFSCNLVSLPQCRLIGDAFNFMQVFCWWTVEKKTCCWKGLQAEHHSLWTVICCTGWCGGKCCKVLLRKKQYPKTLYGLLELQSVKEKNVMINDTKSCR